MGNLYRLPLSVNQFYSILMCQVEVICQYPNHWLCTNRALVRLTISMHHHTQPPDAGQL